MTREELIKQAAKNAATIVTDVAENGNKYCTIIPEWQNFFERGAEWADSHPNGSVIHWQTGEPTEEGEYLAQLKYGHIRIVNWEKFNDYYAWTCFNKEIIAWCPLSEIKPFKDE